MQKTIFPAEYFNARDTLLCGQVFRFVPHEKGFLCFSTDKACYVYTENGVTAVECEESDAEYFNYYFDAARDYCGIVARAEGFGGILATAARLGKGVRVLNQNPEEALISFVISQNNNIPRIKGIIERLCDALGEEKTFGDIKYRAFPTVKALSERDEAFFYGVGLGYRAPFIKRLADELDSGALDLESYKEFSAAELKKALKRIYGVGQKVADCAILFGFHKSDCFPVDVWLEKVYRENFNGTLTDREKISEWFVQKFGEDSGFFQQYLFYYKRSLESVRTNEN